MEVAVRPLYKLNFFAAKMDVDLATDSSISMLAEYAAASLKTLLLNKCLNLTGLFNISYSRKSWENEMIHFKPESQMWPSLQSEPIVLT